MLINQWKWSEVNDDIGDDEDDEDDEEEDEEDDDGDWPASSPCNFSPSFRNLSISATACSRFSTWMKLFSKNTIFPRLNLNNDGYPRNDDDDDIRKYESHDDVCKWWSSLWIWWKATFVRSKPSLAASNAARCSDEAEDLSLPRGSMSSLGVHIFLIILSSFWRLAD